MDFLDLNLIQAPLALMQLTRNQQLPHYLRLKQMRKLERNHAAGFRVTTVSLGRVTDSIQPFIKGSSTGQLKCWRFRKQD